MSKGFYVSPDNEYASNGLRVMEGSFLGNIESFGLHYDTDTKIWCNGPTYIADMYMQERKNNQCSRDV